jgi:hypothetical protein
MSFHDIFWEKLVTFILVIELQYCSNIQRNISVTINVISNFPIKLISYEAICIIIWHPLPLSTPNNWTDFHRSASFLFWYKKVKKQKIYRLTQIFVLFNSPDSKGQVSYCHHLASVVVVRRPSSVVRRKLFQKSSCQKPRSQLNCDFAGMIIGWSCTKIVNRLPIGNSRWPPWLDLV